jgi:hypothetical protein
LSQESSYALLSLLRVLRRCPTTIFVREISTRNRRWWIGSLLDYAERSHVFSRADYERFVFLCQKMLRGSDCGKLLPHRVVALSDSSFPVIPKDDADLRIGVWSEDETQFALDFLCRIEEQRPRFKAPPGRVGIAPQTEEEWNDWVHMMIRQVLAIRELEFEAINVVSFIDS